MVGPSSTAGKEKEEEEDEEEEASSIFLFCPCWAPGFLDIILRAPDIWQPLVAACLAQGVTRYILDFSGAVNFSTPPWYLAANCSVSSSTEWIHAASVPEAWNFTHFLPSKCLVRQWIHAASVPEAWNFQHFLRRCSWLDSGYMPRQFWRRR